MTDLRAAWIGLITESAMWIIFLGVNVHLMLFGHHSKWAYAICGAAIYIILTTYSKDVCKAYAFLCEARREHRKLS